MQQHLLLPKEMVKSKLAVAVVQVEGVDMEVLKEVQNHFFVPLVVAVEVEQEFL